MAFEVIATPPSRDIICMSEDFEVLSRALQIQIDEAFDAARNSNQSIGLSSVKRSKWNAELPGGFDTDTPDPPGGFIPFKTNETEPSNDDLIPLSLIPSALQLLDFPPDDEEVLQVFHNAAGGWSDAPQTDDLSIVSDKEQGRTVARKDWRAVCAVIISDRKDEDVAGGFLIDEEQVTLTGRGRGNPLQEEGTEDEEDEYDESDNGAYQESSLSSLSSGHASDSESDGYIGEPSSSKAKSKSRGRKSKCTSTSIPSGTPTLRQKRASLDAFALFFPSPVPLTDADLITKRLMFKDIVRVADILKEKIKAEEVCFYLKVCINSIFTTLVSFTGRGDAFFLFHLS